MLLRIYLDYAIKQNATEAVMKLGTDIKLPEGAKIGDVSDGYHTFNELYEHRISLFLALMATARQQGLEAGWSRRHDDGELCFGGGWVIAWITAPSGAQARYHMEDTRPLPSCIEMDVGSPWNGKEQTMAALQEIAGGLL